MRKKFVSVIGALMLGIACVAGSVYVESSVNIPQVKGKSELKSVEQTKATTQMEELYDEGTGNTVMYPTKEITCTGEVIIWDEERKNQVMQEEAKKQELREKEETCK